MGRGLSGNIKLESVEGGILAGTKQPVLLKESMVKVTSKDGGGPVR